MKPRDIRNLTAAEIDARLTEVEQEYYAAREAVRSGRDQKTARPRRLRRDIARLKTIKREQPL